MHTLAQRRRRGTRRRGARTPRERRRSRRQVLEQEQDTAGFGTGQEPAQRDPCHQRVHVQEVQAQVEPERLRTGPSRAEDNGQVVSVDKIVLVFKCVQRAPLQNLLTSSG